MGCSNERPGSKASFIAPLTSFAAVEQFESVQELGLALQNFRTGCLDAEPLSPVDLWKKPRSTGSRRPFDAERIADQRLRVPIFLDSPYVNLLATRLLHEAERHEDPSWREPGLLGKFADCSVICRLAVENFAFRNAPSTVILVSPVGTAGMCEQHFKAITISD